MEKIESLPLAALKPYDRNNKKHSPELAKRLAESIKEFGWTYPVLIDEDNIILAGHKRLLAAKALGLKEVPILRKTGLTDEQKRAYRILDNKITHDSPWDLDAVQFELSALEEAGFDLPKFGLDDFPGLELAEAEVTEDDFEADPLDEIETCIKRGDVIELGRHRVMCGDSTSAEMVAELLDGATPFIMVTDPPYGVEYDPEWRGEYDGNLGTRARGKVANDHRIDWTETYRLFPGAVAYVWHAGRHAATLVLNLNEAEFDIRTQIIWSKQQFVFSRGHYHWQHEPCWYAVRPGSSAKWCGDRSQSTIWQISNNSAFSKEKEERTGHGTQKPLECMARPIRNHGGKKDDVYDPFLGSGTTIIAAEQLGRTCYGMEIEPKYCQVIVDRYEAHCRKAGKPFECRINGQAYTPAQKDGG